MGALKDAPPTPPTPSWTALRPKIVQLCPVPEHMRVTDIIAIALYDDGSMKYVVSGSETPVVAR